jgi:hypothetical protein
LCENLFDVELNKMTSYVWIGEVQGPLARVLTILHHWLIKHGQVCTCKNNPNLCFGDVLKFLLFCRIFTMFQLFNWD